MQRWWPRRTTERSENPLSWAFWLGSVDPRPLALFRVALGIAVLHDLVDLAFELRAFLTDEGMLPRGAVRGWWTWSVFDLVGSPAAVAIVYAAGAVAVLAFTVGYRTRLATAASWLFLVSILHRNLYVTDGGDKLTAILFFWSIFADTGACWSVDAWLRARRSSPSRPAGVFAIGPRLLQASVAVLYLMTGRLKYRMGWLHGTAIYQALQLDGFVRPPGAWVGAHPGLCAALTYAVLAMELSFAFFAFSPVRPRVCRAIAIGLNLAVQLGILVTMRMGIFTEVTLATSLLFLQPEWVDRAEAWLAPKAGLAAVRVGPAWRSGSALGRKAAVAFAGALCLQFVTSVWDGFAGRRLPLPEFLSDERLALSLEPAWDLFGTTYELPHWDAPGVVLGGRQVEVLSIAAPGTRPRGPGLRFSRWHKFTMKWRERPFLFAELGRYLCRAYDERTGERLLSFDLTNDVYDPVVPGQAVPPHAPRLLWRQACDGSEGPETTSRR